MTDLKWAAGVALMAMVLSASCVPPQSGAIGPEGYEQTKVKYRLGFSDPAKHEFLPTDWVVDNYAGAGSDWTEKSGKQYRAIRELDMDGNGTISALERKEESLFDLRFVNTRDNAVIWLKVHPLATQNAKRDLDVILENYADGLAGAGLFEQSSLFGLKADMARQFTSFIVRKEATQVGALPAIRGVIEIADVEKLRLDAAHRDSKAELLFAKVTYVDPFDRHTDSRDGLLVIGYYDDASRFDSHLADFHALLGRISVPPSAVPPDATPVKLPSLPAAQPGSTPSGESQSATPAPATAPPGGAAVQP